MTGYTIEFRTFWNVRKEDADFKTWFGHSKGRTLTQQEVIEYLIKTGELKIIITDDLPKSIETKPLPVSHWGKPVK